MHFKTIDYFPINIFQANVKFLYPLETKIYCANFEADVYRSSHRRCFIKKAFLKNFEILTGKHLCWSLFFNKVAGLRPAMWATTLIEGYRKGIFNCQNNLKTNHYLSLICLR